MLLGVETQDANSSLINDNTVEGAVVLMEKIGYMIDEKLTSLKAGEEGGESGKGKKSEQADAGVKDKIIKTFARLNELASDTSVPPVSTRVKMLIKNMLENRAQGWERTKKQDESGPMKVDELREKLEKKLREEQAIRDQAEQEEQSYLGGGGGGRRDDYGNYKKAGTYQEKGSGGRGGKGGRDDRPYNKHGGDDRYGGGNNRREPRLEKNNSSQ